MKTSKVNHVTSSAHYLFQLVVISLLYLLCDVLRALAIFVSFISTFLDFQALNIIFFKIYFCLLFLCYVSFN
jgi:hypothetical protein